MEAEILLLRHQLNVMQRSSPKRVTLSSVDRLLLVALYRLAPGVLDALKIIRPETDRGRVFVGERGRLTALGWRLLPPITQVEEQ